MFSIVQIVILSSLLSVLMCHTILKRHVDFSERFLERKRQRQIKDQRLTVSNIIVLKDTEVLDDITHYRKKGDSSSKKWKKINAIEEDFRRLLAMDGMKYNYKRDVYWRTWRTVSSVIGVKEVVCYRCNNPIQVNATGCQNCGMWTIEERPPPCPYEFFSVMTDEKLCGANYTQYKDLNTTCPSVIKFSDLTATCDNPIETEWRFSKMYGVPEKYDSVICQDNDFCEIFTSYEISPEHVIFRIINSTNDVMYSRIMKPNNTNYICIEDCGRFNPNTRKVTKTDKPLKLDLLTVRIMKTEDSLNEINESRHFPTGAILPPVKGNIMSLSNIGGNDLANIDKVEEKVQHKIKSRVMKRQQSNFDLEKDLVEKFLISLGATSPKPTDSHCQKLEREADHLSYEDENEELE